MEAKLYGTVLLKAKVIMNVLLEANGGLTLDEISSKAIIPKPTTFKILKTLDYIKFVRKDAAGKKYFLGTKMIGYGNKALKGFDIVSLSNPYIKQLSEVTNETINLGIEEDFKVILLKKIDSRQPINLNSRVGGSMELYSSAMGKAILATKTDEELDQYFSEVQLKPLTDNTVTSINELRQQIIQIKKDKFALENQENQDEVVCIGIAIEKYGKLFGAISISIPEYRLNNFKLADLEKLIISVKNKITKAI
ncbi:IclR family transcriptional regulator [Lactobacillus sp. ESL0791]|uniref:IclR family transcriptional regulator n=1 Tax=Lactobacillus sp. ESL0791 TaxID=2983234 RepID=UPI0023F724D0|nr:IclR family transcriptional regulator [Lactobacillus sp. ESL0791]MDF7637906.1 IclR family transcriptional regulator [Lactobacillus sp. ESL0791]